MTTFETFDDLTDHLSETLDVPGECVATLLDRNRHMWGRYDAIDDNRLELITDAVWSMYLDDKAKNTIPARRVLGSVASRSGSRKR